MTDFMRVCLNVPFTTTHGREWQAVGGGNKKEGSYSAKVGGSDASGASSPADSCEMSVDSQWGTKGIFRKKPTELVNIKDQDKTPNLDAKLTRDAQGQGTLHVTNSSGTFSSEVEVPVGDVSKADAKYFEAGAFAGQTISSVDVARLGEEGGIRFNSSDKQSYAIKNGAIFVDG